MTFEPIHFPGTPNWLWWLHPWVLLLLLVLPLLAWVWSRKRRRAVIRYSDTSALVAARGSFTPRLRGILPALRLGALACLIVAVARPQIPDETSRTFTEGIAIMLAVDVSSSMSDADLSTSQRNLVTRLTVVKRVVHDFVDKEGELGGRPNDLVGLVRFAKYADSVCPLTLDHKNLLKVLDRLDFAVRADDGTAIGDGLALAVERMRDLERKTGSGELLKIKSRVVILLTDGENNAGEIAPEQAAQLAAEFDVKVYTILVGTGRMVGFGMHAPVDDSQLKAIAETTGGKFFSARDPEALEGVYAQIDELEKTSVEEQSFVRWGELSQGWLLAAFVLLATQLTLDATWLRRIP